MNKKLTKLAHEQLAVLETAHTTQIWTSEACQAREAIRRLAPDFRKILHLRHELGQSLADVARDFEVDGSVIENLHKHACIRFAEVFASLDPHRQDSRRSTRKLVRHREPVYEPVVAEIDAKRPLTLGGARRLLGYRKGPSPRHFYEKYWRLLDLYGPATAHGKGPEAVALAQRRTNGLNEALSMVISSVPDCRRAQG